MNSHGLMTAFQETLDTGARAEALPRGALRMKIEALLSLLVVQTLTSDLLEGPVSQAKASPGDLMLTMRDHIMNCSGKGITLDHFAYLSGYSKYHFHRMFKAQTGMTVHQCINEARVRTTRELLDAGHLHKQISIELGFNNPTAFSRWYRAQGLRD